MPDQPDLWPLMAPKNDPDFPLRARWRHALMLLGALEIDGLPLRDVQKWVKSPNMSDVELASIFYGRDGAAARVAEARDFLLEQGLIEDENRC